MKTEENDFTKKVIKFARAHGWLTAHFRPGMMANGRWITAVSGDGKGFPDLVLVRGGELIFVELKVGSGELSDEQINWMYRLMKAGATCYKWTPRMWEEIEKTLT